jgi:hypothetical protein
MDLKHCIHWVTALYPTDPDLWTEKCETLENLLLDFIARLVFEVKVVRREIFTCGWEICFSFHCCFQSLSSVSFTAAFCISPTGCFICHSCCLFMYQPHRFYQSCYFLLYLAVLLIPSLFFISPANSLSISSANSFSVLYQACCFGLYSLSVLLLPSLFSVNNVASFSILYQ